MHWRRIQELSYRKLALLPVVAGLGSYAVSFMLTLDLGEALFWSIPCFLGWALACSLIALIKVFRTRNRAGASVAADLEKSQ